MLTFILFVDISVAQVDALFATFKMKPVSRAVSPSLWHNIISTSLCVKDQACIVSFLEYCAHCKTEPKAQVISTSTA